MKRNLSTIAASKLAATTLAATLLISGGSAAVADSTAGEQLRNAEREGRIYATYALNRHLNPFEFKVTVNGDRATIGGTVDEAVDKDLAEQLALSTDGIKKVDNKIVVDEKFVPKAQPAGQRSFSETVGDATITASVKSKLLWNSNTRGIQSHIETRNGVVTLTGAADSASAKELATSLAQNTEGVLSVNNRLQVASKPSTASPANASSSAGNTVARAGEKVTDAWITTKVKSSLAYSKYVSASDIKVETRNGVVTLAGEVKLNNEKEVAVDIAKNIRGVKQVDADRLEVRSDDAKQISNQQKTPRSDAAASR